MGLREQALAAENGVATRDVQAGETVSIELSTEAAQRNGFAQADETDPTIPAEMEVPVHVAWARVMREVQFIEKNRRTEQGARYNYRGIDDIMNAVGPAVRKHGVIVMPVGADPTFETINTTKDRAMNYTRVVARFAVIGPRGDVLPVVAETLGEAFDSGDKSATKASSVALRTFYTQGLSIPTNRPQLDPEYGEQHEIASKRRPTPAEYAAEILDEHTSINRLSQIKAELDSDRETGSAAIELADGESVRLADLVRRVGRQRQEAGR